jgi:ADP-heptose:LPS heptosyltransferase
MAWRRSVAEAVLASAARLCAPRREASTPPRSIFVLRNNDIGDLIVVTPLFDALRRQFPKAEIVAGVGSWNIDLLNGNPHLSEVLPVNAPWLNRVTGRSQSVREGLDYIWRSPEVQELRRRRFDVGIDVVGSLLGSALLLRMGIPHRLGVHGYAGGHTAAHQVVTFDPATHVGTAALTFARLLGAVEVPPNRPQLFVSRQETDAAERRWLAQSIPSRPRVIVSPGGGYPGRAWPEDRFVELTRRLAHTANVIVIGGPDDVALGERVAGPRVSDLTGRLSVRDSIAVISRAQIIFCNSSMAMHAAGAFDVPAVVLLGPDYESASLHARQWGYGGRTIVLGRDRSRGQIFTVEEALKAAAAAFPASGLEREMRSALC